MPDLILPRTVPAVLAARLAGYSPRTFRRTLLEPGLVEVEQSPGGRAFVVLGSLESTLGKRITADEYLAADRALTGRRQWQATYRANRRAAPAAA